MASGETSNPEREQLNKNDKYNPKLDFYSEKFDPLLALRSTSVKPPVANAKIFDNINIYESNVKRQNSEEKKEKPVKKPIEKKEAVIERKWLPQQLPTFVPRKQPKTVDVFNRMDKIVGPLSLLRKCKDNRLRIKIWTRHSHDIRGYCLGFVVVFDKLWNIVLEDVEEVYKRPTRRKVPALDSAAKCANIRPKIYPPEIRVLERTQKFETCVRKVPQLLIRGEQVAFIAVPELNSNINKDNV